MKLRNIWLRRVQNKENGVVQHHFTTTDINHLGHKAIQVDGYLKMLDEYKDRADGVLLKARDRWTDHLDTHVLMTIHFQIEAPTPGYHEVSYYLIFIEK